jgi:hypothetical protein
MGQLTARIAKTARPMKGSLRFMNKTPPVNSKNRKRSRVEELFLFISILQVGQLSIGYWVNFGRETQKTPQPAFMSLPHSVEGIRGTSHGM